jgi:type I restriction enzyme, R subunit
MNEAETRAELIDPQLRKCGWGEESGTKVLREHTITKGKIHSSGGRARPLKADYVLSYNGQKLAVIEAKSDEYEVGEGVAQAKDYAAKMHIDHAYATNGLEIYHINMKTGEEALVSAYPSPRELWDLTFEEQNTWQDKFNEIPFEDISGTKPPYYFQEIAVNKALEAIAAGKDRILLTLATGTGKTFIAFQIVWKLFHSRWNLKRDGGRLPRILFLADRNILADQAFTSFTAFPEDALVRIKPSEIRKKDHALTNGSIFFTIFQTFMTGPDDSPYFGEYPEDFFDFIIIDECHRGGANDESNWRAIMEYFSPAVQLGLTATPKRKHNVDTYSYFGEPVYIYSLKEGINDGFLTPFKVKRIQTTLDEYVYTTDDTIIQGEVEEGKVYQETDFNRIIEIKEREEKRVKLFLKEINQKEKALVFCANQDHALAVRDLINQHNEIKNPMYCVRVTANDGALGEQYLREFQDNEKTIPTILTTSQKLSTGVDARNIRNIILMRPVNSMIEFKQIVGRGTRLHDGKYFFTIYDFVNAYHHFSDPEWDGEPAEPEEQITATRQAKEPEATYDIEEEKQPRPKKLKIKLRDGKEREIQHMMSTSYWNADGTPITAEEFLKNLYGKLPEYFKDEDELRKIWSVPQTRREFLDRLSQAGFGMDQLNEMKTLINADDSDLFDVLEYISYARSPISREKRVAQAQGKIFDGLDNRQRDFLAFVLSKYIETGVEELDQEKLPGLLTLKYQSIPDAQEALGDVSLIRTTFIEFQKYLYERVAG